MRILLVVLMAVAAAGCGGVEREPNLALAVERTEASGSGLFEVRGVQKEEGTLACDGAAI
jgi:hypothetical protein